MKKFIYNIVIFLAVPILYFGSCGLINYFIYSNQDCGIEKNTILVIGDSHVRRAINPALFDSKVVNISQSGEPYIVSYWKLKKIFKYALPDTIILGFARHNISSINDYIFSQLDRSSKLFERSYPIQELRKVHAIEVSYYKYIKVLWRQICWFPKRNHCHYIGSYFNENGTHLSETKRAIYNQYFKFESETGISNSSISYLDSILHICKSNGVVPILVSTPVHEKYINQVPLRNNVKYIQLKQKLNSQGIPIIDRTITNYPDSLFFNVNHLNKKGSNKFTIELIEILSRKMDEES